MARMMSITSLSVVTCGVWAAVGLNSPQYRLWARVAAGQLDCRSASVSSFSPAQFDEDSVPIRLGALSLKVPREALSPGRQHEWGGVGADALSLGWSGIGLMAYSPRPDGVLSYGRDRDLAGASCLGVEEVSLRAAAYSADPAEVSLWMGRARAQRLGDLLSLRSLLPRSVERVELVRAEDIKGTVIFEDLGAGRMGVVFEYFSPDESVSGTAILTLDRYSESAMKTARAIFSSFHIAGDSIAGMQVCSP